jgi:hypothetical protein
MSQASWFEKMGNNGDSGVECITNHSIEMVVVGNRRTANLFVCLNSIGWILGSSVQYCFLPQGGISLREFQTLFYPPGSHCRVFDCMVLKIARLISGSFDGPISDATESFDGKWYLWGQSRRLGLSSETCNGGG